MIIQMMEKYLSAIDISRAGYGIDPYDESGPKDHPMAYGLMASGFARLYQATCNDDYLIYAKLCLRKLRELSLHPAKLCWGLPFSFKGFAPFHPYTITTAIAAEGFLDVYHLSREPAYMHDLRKICSWLVEDLKWKHIDQSKACPWFAPQWPLLANNVASKVGSVLFRSGSILREPRFKMYGTKAMRYVLSRQDLQGFWVYGEQEGKGNTLAVIDNIHTAYTLEGIIDYYYAFPLFIRWCKFDLRKQIQKGLAFYTTYLWDKDRMKAKEKVVVMTGNELKQLYSKSSKSRQWRVESLREQHYFVFYPEESRLWGYGAALTVLAKAWQMNMIPLDVLKGIVEFVKDRLLTEKGRFKYKSDNETHYVRHEAHIFLGLATLLAFLSFQRLDSLKGGILSGIC